MYLRPAIQKEQTERKGTERTPDTPQLLVQQKSGLKASLLYVCVLKTTKTAWTFQKRCDMKSLIN